VPIRKLFDYSVPADQVAAALPGCRVQVSFRDRPLTGVIVERSKSSPLRERLLPIQKVVDAEPVLSAAMLAMLREEAQEVLCPIGIALAAALPSGSAPRRATGYAITPRGRRALDAGALQEDARRVLEALATRPRQAAALRKRCGTLDLSDLERDGLVVRTAVELSPAAQPARERIAELVEGVDAETAASEALARAPRQAALLRHLAQAGPTTISQLRAEFPGASSLLRALEERELIVRRFRPLPREEITIASDASAPPTLTAEQAAALAPVLSSVRERRFESFLLHGVTGSGKTEVYLRAIQEALGSGRQALVLVPEISLTHQIVERLRERFGDELAVLHSGLRPGKRLEQWQRLRSGSTPIAVGARSALFAPLEKLGLIVIDEEHDSAYKNEEGFHYHARTLAQRRGRDAGCPVVMGSATPSLETRFAADRGEIRRLVLPHRIGRRPLPAVSLVDLARERERAPRGQRVILSPPLRRAMADTLSDGGQTILFLNRRGFSTQIMCFDCGAAEHCPNCDVALVYHTDGQRLRCHYCDHSIAPPDTCSQCGAPDAALLGIGTQRVEEEVRIHFPNARIARLDRDTARARGFTESVLRDIKAGRVDIVIGTQIVAKGHDYPGVRLVGVVLADIGLHMPDFRAAERTFQLLTQVAGRAGRDATPGRVIVQTFAPDHYAIQPVVDHDFERFYVEELGHRAALGYPPFGFLAHALVSGVDAEEAAAAAAQLAEALAPQTKLQVLGPAPAPFTRLRGRYRFQLLVKSTDREALHAGAEILCEVAAQLPASILASVDTHPINML
jgi:primosomal protein N' (replication factor Y)